MTFHGKTYTNDFPFSNGIPFRSRSEAVRKKFASVRKYLHPFERLDHPFGKSTHPFERLDHPFGKNTHPFERLDHPFGKNTNPFERLCHPFGKNTHPFERLGHPFGKNSHPFERLDHPLILVKTVMSTVNHTTWERRYAERWFRGAKVFFFFL